MKKLLLFLFISSIWISVPLKAEIQEITLMWKGPLCGAPCINLLSERLRMVQGVDKISMDQAGGMAHLSWKSNVPFSFYPLNAAARYVGIRVDNIFLKIKGKIKLQYGKYYIVSDGDNTQFELLGVITPQKNQMVQNYNPVSHPLSQQTIAQLTEILNNKQSVVISGPFFEPYRSPPNMVIIQSIQTEDQKR